jgi:hypothetical protein
MSILDQYVKEFPDHQNALDIFKGEWSSKLPPPYENMVAGKTPLFEDQRIEWAEKQLGGLGGFNVLELGPLEGGHTYMLEKKGANSILAIEANTRSYMKCLISKEILSLKSSRFMLGDFISYLESCKDYYDLCVASGVLYHMKDPVKLIYLISQVCSKVMIWTHYYDQSLIQNNPNISNEKFSDALEVNYQGFKHVLHRYHYNDALNWSGFCGGSDKFSMWMSKNDILSCLNYFGFKKLEIGFDHTMHPNGPSFCILGFKNAS